MLTILAAVIVGAYLGAGIVLAWWAYCDRRDRRQ